MTQTQSYFTLTSGRSGTAWLGAFLSENLGFDVVHEPMEIEDFGVNMPDIRTMRHFNTYGNDAFIQAFWTQKLAKIARYDRYAETNHTLAKCGLIENLALSELADTATVIVLRRNLVKQCVSHLIRHDFVNVTTAWQWYLHPDYPKRFVSAQPFLHMGPLGMAVWYCFEMSARQRYYVKTYSNRLRMIEVDLETITQESGAKAFRAQLDGGSDVVLPAATNQNAQIAPDALIEKVKDIFAAVQFDLDAVVDAAIKQGVNFDAEMSAPQVKSA